MPKEPSHLKVLTAGIMSLILCLGVARFAYTPLLPVMQAETWLGDASGGWLATFNYAGYMCGALIAASLSNLHLKDTLYRIGLLLAVFTTTGMALSESMLLWSVMRFIAGLSSAAGLLIGSGLILNWLIRHHHRMELGVHFAGVGLGIVLSAVAVDAMIAHFSWDQQWLALSLVGFFLLVPAWGWLPRPGQGDVTQSGQQLEDNPPERGWMYILFASYFCAGFGYVISATFLVAIVEGVPETRGRGELVWLVAGLAATPACIIWDRVARRMGELKALLAAYALQIIGIVLPALDSSLSMVIFSAALYGGTFIGIVSLMLTMVGKFYPTKPSKPMGKLTLSYGVAQIAAPALAGHMAEVAGNYNGALYLAAGVMLVGMLFLAALIYKKREAVGAVAD